MSRNRSRDYYLNKAAYFSQDCTANCKETTNCKIVGYQYEVQKACSTFPKQEDMCPPNDYQPERIRHQGRYDNREETYIFKPCIKRYYDPCTRHYYRLDKILHKLMPPVVSN